MNKLEALTEIFNVENIFDKLKRSKCKIQASDLLRAISKPTYALDKELGVASTTVTRTIKYLWPEKPVIGGTKVCVYLLSKYGYRLCPNCETVYLLENFHSNSGRVSGVNTYCKFCCLDMRREYQREYQAGRRATKLQRTPSWSQTEDIKKFYDNCPAGYHVDHIIPLQGKNVSGLHVLENLQYLSAVDNMKKGNSF